MAGSPPHGHPAGLQWDHSQGHQEEFYAEPPHAQNSWYYPQAPGYDQSHQHGDPGFHDGYHDETMNPSAPRKKRAQVRIACTHCQKACKKCSDQRPCERCVKYGLEDCVDSTRKPRKSGIKRGPYKRRQNKGVMHSIKDAYYGGMADTAHHPYDRMVTDFDAEPPYPRGYHDAFLPPIPTSLTPPMTGWSDEAPTTMSPANFGTERRLTFPSINTLVASRNVTPQPPTSGFDVAPIHQVAPTFYSPLGQVAGTQQAYSAPPSPRQSDGTFPGMASQGPDWDDLRAALQRSSSAAPPDRSLEADQTAIFKPAARLPPFHPFNRLRVGTGTGHSSPVHSSPLSSPATQSPTLFDQPMEMDLDELSDVKPLTDVEMGGTVDRWPNEVGKTVGSVLGI